MGDFSEHILFGMLTATLIGFLAKDLLSLSLFDSIVSILAIAAGSVLPDIDHKKSYVHRSVKAFLSIAAGFSALLLPLNINLRFLLAITLFLAVYVLVSGVKMKHRGFTHSISFCAIVASTVVVVSVLFLGTPLPGTAIGIGLLSHLLLDGEIKLE